MFSNFKGKMDGDEERIALEDRALAEIELSVMGMDDDERQAREDEARLGPFSEEAGDDDGQRAGESDAEFARRLLAAADEQGDERPQHGADHRLYPAPS